MSAGDEDSADSIARAFHDTYERMAPSFAYLTRAESRTEWDEVPENNRLLMRAVVQELIDQGVIRPL